MEPARHWCIHSFRSLHRVGKTCKRRKRGKAACSVCDTWWHCEAHGAWWHCEAHGARTDCVMLREWAERGWREPHDVHGGRVVYHKGTAPTRIPTPHPQARRCTSVGHQSMSSDSDKQVAYPSLARGTSKGCPLPLTARRGRTSPCALTGKGTPTPARRAPATAGCRWGLPRMWTVCRARLPRVAPTHGEAAWWHVSVGRVLARHAFGTI